MLITDIQARIRYVQHVRKLLTRLVDILCANFGSEDVVSELCMMRKYTDPRMFALLASKKVFKMPTLSDIQILASAQGITLDPALMRHLGLIDDSGNYFLEYRYVLPLRNYGGTVIALVCWYPDKRKYITTGTLGFTNTATFFNQESYTKAYKFPDGVSRVFVVEGIFDALSIESLGYCAFGNQGLAMSSIKKEMLTRFDKVYFIPDNDKPGRKSSKFTCLRSSHLWDIPNSTVIQLSGACKDMDDFIKMYGVQDLDKFLVTDPVLKIM